MELLVSAGVSALVSATIAWAVAGHLTTRQKRAEAALEARRGLKRLVAPLLRQVVQYRAGLIAGRPDAGHLSDAQLAAEFLRVAEPLPWWGRWLVRRRVRRLVGAEWFDLAELHDPASGEEVVAGWLLSGIADARSAGGGEDVARSSDLGLLRRGLTAGPGSADAAALERALRRLAKGW